MTTTSADAKFWDDIAEKYAAKPVEDVPAFERKKAITREHLRPDSTILEIGCGTGSLALEMSRHAGHVHAMDISTEMIRIANRKKETQRVTNVSFHVGTLDGGSPLGAAKVDGVWAYSILHLVQDRQRTLRTLFEALEPGGVFISSNVCLGDSWVPYGALLAVMRWLGKAPAVRIYDRATIVREMKDAGFVDVEEKDVGAERTVAFFVARKP
ncbi:class I SAM-dependent methyltransferase [Sandaracinus amylolyticus]|uniref:Putative methyltransferase n=1 Tax=Sandaracinus amylolyticus TaxID=927083 RepID=A0A0F6W7Y0_9BACT|nr:class I SAM-dependent methyltransferase [Sandaracinus amylolyticus]AKF09590.1 Putative methyltransferase [Sandaracinus amylolyticus]